MASDSVPLVLASKVFPVVLVLVGACGSTAPLAARQSAAAPDPAASRPAKSSATVPVASTPPVPPKHPAARPSDTGGSEPGDAEDAPPNPFEAPLPDPALTQEAPAMRFANLSPTECRSELNRRGLPFVRDRRPTPGVASAFRITGPLGGVRIVAPGPSSPFGVFDCRLSLALEQFAAVLDEQRVSSVHVGSAYRRSSKLGSRRKPSQHAHGLALDVVGFTMTDGRTLLFERDWQGEVGQPPCGPGSEPSFATEDAVTLRNVICEVARRGVFHTILTPNYDAAHHDHVHLDIRRGAIRRILR